MTKVENKIAISITRGKNNLALFEKMTLYCILLGIHASYG